jgi:hypothetical protein
LEQAAWEVCRRQYGGKPNLIARPLLEFEMFTLWQQGGPYVPA